jgi:hypothetical protein
VSSVSQECWLIRFGATNREIGANDKTRSLENPQARPREEITTLSSITLHEADIGMRPTLSSLTLVTVGTPYLAKRS